MLGLIAHICSKNTENTTYSIEWLLILKDNYYLNKIHLNGISWLYTILTHTMKYRRLNCCHKLNKRYDNFEILNKWLHITYNRNLENKCYQLITHYPQHVLNLRNAIYSNIYIQYVLHQKCNLCHKLPTHYIHKVLN